MKKILIISFLLFTFLLNPLLAFAEDKVNSNKDTSSTESARIEYELPYPGILPDNPLYFFKNIRDKVIRFFISDSFKKAEYDLLQADKKLNAGYYLSIRHIGKDDLIVSTVSGGEDCFENAVKELEIAKKQGVDVSTILEKTILSSKKHQEVLGKLKDNISSNFEKNIEKELKRSQNFEELVRGLKSK